MQGATVVFAPLGDLSVNALVNMFDEPLSRIHLIFAVASALYAGMVC